MPKVQLLFCDRVDLPEETITVGKTLSDPQLFRFFHNLTSTPRNKHNPGRCRGRNRGRLRGAKGSTTRHRQLRLRPDKPDRRKRSQVFQRDCLAGQKDKVEELRGPDAEGVGLCAFEQRHHGAVAVDERQDADNGRRLHADAGLQGADRPREVRHCLSDCVQAATFHDRATAKYVLLGHFE